MGGFFRSEEMSRCQILLHKESAFDCLVELGYMGMVQFIETSNLSGYMQYANEVKRCSDMQRIVNKLQEKIDEIGMKTIYYPDVDSEEIPLATDVKDIELMLTQLDEELHDVSGSTEALRHKYAELIELSHVLSKADEFLTGERNTDPVMAWSNSIVMQLIHDETKHVPHTDSRLKISFFAGTIPIERFHAFEVMLWRVCHHNFFLKHNEIPEAVEDEERWHGVTRKYVFVVFFVGIEVRQKITKVCQGFHAKIFTCSESFDERRELSRKVATDLEDLKLILGQSDEHRRRILYIAAADLFIWRVKIKKILMVYAALNQMNAMEESNNLNYLQSECWIPTSEIPNVRECLLRGVNRTAKGNPDSVFLPMISEKVYAYKLEPPTFFRLNKFTKGFQNLIDAYGIAVYRELNPTPYTIITFPFLFAVMFGDVGHGLIMAIFGMWMVIREKQLEHKNLLRKGRNEIWDILFAGRYIILLMGVFSVYTGLIYNDIFSKAFNIFGSKWRVNYTSSVVAGSKELQLDPAKSAFYLGTPYVFGMDPVWDASGENSIICFNSLKMKLAVVLGVSQMLFGLSLSAWNFIYTKNYVDLYLVFVPQLVFLLCLFFYLVFLVLFKWSIYGGHKEPPYNTACAPSVLITFIDMILMKGDHKVPAGCNANMYNGQSTIQMILVVVAFCCIPVLLIGKPLHFQREQAKIKAIRDSMAKEMKKRNTASSLRKSMVYHVHATKEEDVNLSEVWIHQGIHCIESILGSVSHTASYLRLWALSLAHDQLSTVLWNMVLAMGLKSDRGLVNSLVLYCVFWFWAILTVAILVVMEGLSAFLHTLRLHWVEFQSKFYTGSGQVFMPFRFERSCITD